jgi:hypothetical protein
MDLTYGVGDVVTLMFVFDSVLVSVLVSGDGDSFMIVVLLSFFSGGGLVTVVSFCSQPKRNAAPATMRIYFFIVLRSQMPNDYGVGDAAGDSEVPPAGLVVVVVVSGVVAVAGVVAAGLAAGSVVSVFCSHAARSAAPARMQMYFFIM